MVDGQTYMWYSIVKKTHVVNFWPKYGINMNKFVPCPYLLNSSNCLFGSSVSNWPCNNVFILVVDYAIIWRKRGHYLMTVIKNDLQFPLYGIFTIDTPIKL